MPNWCENDLTVRGPSHVIEAFLSLITGESIFDFGNVIPYPETFRRLDDHANEWDKAKAANPNTELGPRPIDGFSSGGREWCVENWGTKWPAAAVRIEAGKQTAGGLEVVIHFSTAWSPPKPVIWRASALFPSLRFVLRYFEAGAGFQGEYVTKYGECIRDESSSYRGNRGG
jgi:hypothetical protein